MLVVGSLAAVLQPDLGASGITLILAAELAILTGYQTYSVGSGLMRSEGSWLMRHYRRKM